MLNSSSIVLFVRVDPKIMKGRELKRLSIGSCFFFNLKKRNDVNNFCVKQAIFFFVHLVRGYWYQKGFFVLFQDLERFMCTVDDDDEGLGHR